MSKHSELPWLIVVDVAHTVCDNTGGILQSFYDGIDKNAINNAEFIVRACNSHYKLLEALKRALPIINEAHTNLVFSDGDHLKTGEVFELVRAAISKAEATNE